MSDPLIVQVIAAGIVIAILSVVLVLAVVLLGAGCVTIVARIANKIDALWDHIRHAA